jgi:hypothetical protein
MGVRNIFKRKALDLDLLCNCNGPLTHVLVLFLMNYGTVVHLMCPIMCTICTQPNSQKVLVICIHQEYKSLGLVVALNIHGGTLN